MFAAKTKVPVERSRAEIERLLHVHKATQHLTAIDNENHRAIVQFKMNNRVVKFEVSLPQPPDPKKGPQLRLATLHDQITRQRWRALLLVLKAKLEAIENNISTFDSEFLSHIIVPGTNRTVGEYIAPQLAAAYEKGSGPLQLTSGAQ